MRFYPPETKPSQHLALTDGRTMLVEMDGTEITDPAFYKVAVEKGCVPEGLRVGVSAAKAEAPAESRPQVDLQNERESKIMEAMVAMTNAPPEDRDALFTTEGLPKATLISQELGITLTANERNAIWEKLSHRMDPSLLGSLSVQPAQEA